MKRTYHDRILSFLRECKDSEATSDKPVAVILRRIQLDLNDDDITSIPIINTLLQLRRENKVVQVGSNWEYYPYEELHYDVR